MHDLSKTSKMAAALFYLSSCACQAAVSDGEQGTATSETDTSSTNVPSTSESSGTTLSETTTGSGDSESSSSTTTSPQPAEYSAVGANDLGFKYRWIQVQKYDPAREYCITVSMIEDPGQPQPGFDNVEMWGIWRVEAGWVRAPVVDCQDRDVELTPVNAVSGRVVPEANENSPCMLPLVELSIDLAPSDGWPSTDTLAAENLAIEEAFWCD